MYLVHDLDNVIFHGRNNKGEPCLFPIKCILLGAELVGTNVVI